MIKLKFVVLPFLFLVMFLMSGCATVEIIPEENQSTEAGAYPENYKELVNQYFDNRLKEPYTAKFRFIEKPARALQRFPSGPEGDNRHLGYLVYVDVNAKNSYGGYTGWEEFRFLIRDGQIVHRFTRNPHIIETWYK